MGLRWRNFSPFGLLFLIAAQPAHATEVNVVGLFSGKAVVVVNGGRQQVLSAGQKSPEGVRLISADSSAAVLEIDGKRQTLVMGQTISTASTSSGGSTNTTLTADSQGHFVTLASINGASARFLVDTGATFVSMSSATAKSMGISYLNGERGLSSTANGVVPVYRVILNNVNVVYISLNQVEGSVHEGSYPPVVLLGMSFLKRLEMKREGNILTLVKKY